jgi:uridine kinase
MGRLLRHWADPIVRGENVRLRAERRNLRRIVRDLRNAHRTLEHVAAMRSAHIGRLQMQLAEAQQGEPK